MIDLSIGLRIKEVRGKLSQPKFAKALESESFKITAQSLMNYEKGYRMPPIELLMRIVEVFQVDKVWLFFGTTEENNPILTLDWVPADGKSFYLDLITTLKNSPYMFYDLMRRWPRIKKSSIPSVQAALNEKKYLEK